MREKGKIKLMTSIKNSKKLDTIILGIESSCDDTAAAVLKKRPYTEQLRCQSGNP